MSFLSRLFRRQAPPIDRRRLNEDWRAGDLAVCIGDNWMPGGPRDPAAGDLLRVSRVCDALQPDFNVRAYFLCFVGMDGGMWECTAFRKVRLDAEPAEAEFTAMIKRPVRKPVQVLRERLPSALLLAHQRTEECIPMENDPIWIIWSNEHGKWWRPARRGYTSVIETAGRYPRRIADEILRESNFGGRVDEVALLAPEAVERFLIVVAQKAD